MRTRGRMRRRPCTTSREATTRGDEPAHRGDDALAFEEEVLGEWAEGRQAPRGGREVAPPVVALLRPPLVVGTAVALDHEPSLDEEVDASDTADPHLRLVAQPQLPEDQPHEAFGPRFGGCVRER